MPLTQTDLYVCHHIQFDIFCKHPWLLYSTCDLSEILQLQPSFLYQRFLNTNALLVSLNWNLIGKGAARTRAPAATNYDVHSPAWGDARANSPSGSAMEAPALSHRPCWSPIDPAQVSMFICCSHHSLYTSLLVRPLYVGYIHSHTLCVYTFPLVLWLYVSIYVFIHQWPMSHALPPPPLTIPCTMIRYLLYQ